MNHGKFQQAKLENIFLIKIRHLLDLQVILILKKIQKELLLGEVLVQLYFKFYINLNY